MTPEFPTESVSDLDLPRESVAATLTPGTLVAQRYSIVRPLGSGGSCVVYRATDNLLGHDVALKVLRADRVSAHALGRMRREVALARQIQSPYVVRIHDLGTADGLTFLTMELVDGETLADRRQHGPMEISEILRVATAILQALVEIHKLGIVHRDIKPSNILIDTAGNIKVGDLGLARQFDTSEPQLTRTEALVGTLPYLSPEQALGLKPDARSDLYSFGATLFESLTGQLPFERETAIGTLASHINERPPSTRSLRSDVPRWLDAFVLRLLEKEPRNRFQSAADALRSLEARRVPYAWRRLAGPMIALALCGAVALAAWIYGRPAPVRAVVDTPTGVRAVDADGNELWRRDGLRRNRLFFLKRSGRRTLIAALEGRADHLDKAARSRLLLINPKDGRTVREVELPTGDSFFPDFSREYWANPTVIDSDHDGNDELLIGNAHVYWPYYAVHYDSRTEHARLVFVSAGHRFSHAVADVDGDGRDEIILAGMENLMGWYSAVDVVSLRGVATFRPACSQGLLDSNCENGTILWSNLLRPAWVSSVDVDAASRTIHVQYRSGATESIAFDGRRPGNRIGLSSGMLTKLRTEAFQHLRASRRMEEGGMLAEAEAEAREAERVATTAGETQIAEWAKRRQIRALIARGDIAGAERAIDALRASPSAPNIAFDAGKLLYLHGDARRALEYFRTGLFAHREHDPGRLKYEFVEGALFALTTLGRPQEAVTLIEGAAAAYPEMHSLRNVLVATSLWLAGRDFELPPDAFEDTDLRRYWRLELRWAKTADAPAMLPLVRQELNRRGTASGLVQSLEAEVLAALGRHEEATASAQEALRWVEANRNEDMAARAHEQLVRLRTERTAVRGDAAR